MVTGQPLAARLRALSRGEAELPLEAELDGRTLRLEAVLRALPDQRLVLRARWGEQAVVLKLFLDQARGERHARREHGGLRALSRAGLATPELLWQGQWSGLPALVSAWLTDARGLDDCLEAEPARRNERLRALGALWAELHRAGLCHGDPHLGNILCQGERLWLLDGDAVSAAPGEGSRRDNLALLLAQFSVLQREALRTVAQAYGARLDEPALALALREARRTRARRHAAKACRTATAFIARCEQRQRLCLAREFDTPALRALLAQPDAAIAAGTLLKDGHTCTVARVECGEQALVIKRYNLKSPLHALSRSARATRAAISWRNAHYLRAFGLPTPAPVALLERRVGPLRGTAYFITVHQPAWRPDEHFRAQGITAGWRELERMAALVNALGEVGLTHGDLKAGNFLVCGGGEVQFIDLDAMRLQDRAPVFRRAYARDLRRFLANWQDDPELLRAFRQKLQPALGLAGREL